MGWVSVHFVTYVDLLIIQVLCTKDDHVNRICIMFVTYSEHPCSIIQTPIVRALLVRPAPSPSVQKKLFIGALCFWCSSNHAMLRSVICLLLLADNIAVTYNMKYMLMYIF